MNNPFGMWWARQNSNLRPLPCQGSVGTQSKHLFAGLRANAPEYVARNWLDNWGTGTSRDVAR